MTDPFDDYFDSDFGLPRTPYEAPFTNNNQPPPAGEALPADVVTELMDPEFLNRVHYSDTLASKCRGPLCSRYNADRSRYNRRVKSIARVMQGVGTFAPRDGAPNRERAALTRIIIAVLIANNRVIPNHLVSAANRDNVKIPSAALRSPEPPRDAITQELLAKIEFIKEENKRKAARDAQRKREQEQAQIKAELTEKLINKTLSGAELTKAERILLGLPMVSPDDVSTVLATLPGLEYRDTGREPAQPSQHYQPTHQDMPVIPAEVWQDVPA